MLCCERRRAPARICLLDKLATPLSCGVMPLTVGKAQVMADLNASRKAVAAQYAQQARYTFFRNWGSDVVKSCDIVAHGGRVSSD